MYDLHMHILPGLDDGAEDMEEAVEMAETAVFGGTAVCAATSHGKLSKFSLRDLEQYLAAYRKKLEEFRRELTRRQIPLQVVSGMELLADSRLLEYAESHALPGYGTTRTILVEFHFDISFRRAADTLDELQRKKYRVILAHPERYDFIRQEYQRARTLFRDGVILQVNSGSMEGRFGRSVFHAADYILGEGLAGLVASDAHDSVLRTADLEETTRILDLSYGNGAAEVLLEENPARILSGRHII